MRTIISLSLIFTFLSSTAVAQSGTRPADATKNIQQSQGRSATLTNQDLLELQKAGLSAEELVAKIRSSSGEFDVSDDALKQLRNVGVADEVIAAMIEAQSSRRELKTSEATDEKDGDGVGVSAEPLRVADLRIPIGTPLDVESAYTLTSADLRPGELISFRVVVPVRINDAIVIDKGALVTGRVLESKRGRHWGRAGLLYWTMQDVLAVDGSRIPVQAQPAKGANKNGVTGTSYAGEVATKTAVIGALMIPVFPIAPLALMNGYKRGENAVLPEGKRFIVYTSGDSIIKITPRR
jgi:hypothetical protein